jgi:hypothetical protein
VRKLNKETLKSIAYAQNAMCFIFMDNNAGLIDEAYLYGSAARGGLGKGSDIDIFLNCSPEKEKQVEIIAKSSLSRFYKSKDYDKWKLFKFDYPISVQAGNLSEWHLKSSIMAEGILIYSKKTEILPSKRQVLVIFELPKNKKKYLHLIRGLFGRNEKGYNDKGILGSLEGIRISSNVIIVPKENQKSIMDFMQKNKVDYSMKEACFF